MAFRFVSLDNPLLQPALAPVHAGALLFMTDKKTIEAALLTAGKEAQLKVTEEGGNNKGKRVETYLKSVGLGPGYPWCAAFVHWSLRTAGYTAGPTSGATVVWRDWAKKNNRLIALQGVKRGDLFGWTNNDGTGHIGWIAETRKILGVTQIRTVEGNTNKEGSREGDSVLSKWRIPTKKYWFINLVNA